MQAPRSGWERRGQAPLQIRCLGRCSCQARPALAKSPSPLCNTFNVFSSDTVFSPTGWIDLGINHWPHCCCARCRRRSSTNSSCPSGIASAAAAAPGPGSGRSGSTSSPCPQNWLRFTTARSPWQATCGDRGRASEDVAPKAGADRARQRSHPSVHKLAPAHHCTGRGQPAWPQDASQQPPTQRQALAEHPAGQASAEQARHLAGTAGTAAAHLAGEAQARVARRAVRREVESQPLLSCPLCRLHRPSHLHAGRVRQTLGSRLWRPVQPLCGLSSRLLHAARDATHRCQPAESRGAVAGGVQSCMALGGSLRRRGMGPVGKAAKGGPVKHLPRQRMCHRCPAHGS